MPQRTTPRSTEVTGETMGYCMKREPTTYFAACEEYGTDNIEVLLHGTNETVFKVALREATNTHPREFWSGKEMQEEKVLHIEHEKKILQKEKNILESDKKEAVVAMSISSGALGAVMKQLEVLREKVEGLEAENKTLHEKVEAQGKRIDMLEAEVNIMKKLSPMCG